MMQVPYFQAPQHIVACMHAGGDPFGSSLIPDPDTYLASALDPGFESAEPESTTAGLNASRSSDTSAAARVISPTGNVAVDRTIRIRQILVRMRQEARSLLGVAAGGGSIGTGAAAPAAGRILPPTSSSASSSRHSRSSWEPWLLPLEDGPPHRSGIVARRRRANAGLSAVQSGAETERQPLGAESAQVPPPSEAPLPIIEQQQQQRGEGDRHRALAPLPITEKHQLQQHDEGDQGQALDAPYPEDGITLSKGKKKKGQSSPGVGEKKLAALAGVMGSSIEAASIAANKQPNLISRRGGALSANMDKLEAALGLPRCALEL